MGQVLRASVDTSTVPARDRLDFWAERCSATIVGLTCATVAEEGLVARMDHYDMGSFRLFDIRGGEHQVSRSAALVRTREKDSVFLELLAEGSAYLNRNGRCQLFGAGDVILLDTNAPYIHGFPGPMRLLNLDLPGPEFRARFPGWDLTDALRIEGGHGPGAAIARAMRRTLSAVMARSHSAPRPEAVEEVWAVLEQMRDLLTGGSALSAYHQGILRRTRALVRERLGDPGLSTGAVAAAIGISARQLNRILGQQGLSVHRLIQSERLGRARRALEAGQGGTLAELAWRCGFAGPSQFSRAYRREYGHAPSAARGGPALSPAAG